MATLCGQAHCGSLPHVDGPVSCSTSPSMQLQIRSPSTALPPLNQITLPPLRPSTSSIFGTSSYLLVRPPHHSRALRRSQPGLVREIRAAFIFEWIGNIIRFLTKTPLKLIAQRLEDDLDRAAKMVKSGANMVAEAAREADEFAEKVERIAEQAEEFAEKVAEDTETIEEHVREVLDVIEGEKKLVITSFKVVDSEDEAVVKSTTIVQNGDTGIVTVETSTTIDGNLEKTNSP